MLSLVFIHVSAPGEIQDQNCRVSLKDKCSVGGGRIITVEITEI